MPNPIEHSPALGIVNKEVLDATNLAYATAVNLASRGFIVKGVMAGRKDPVVWLVFTGKCQSLKKAITQKIISNSKGKEKFKAAQVDGCEVRWVEREAA